MLLCLIKERKKYFTIFFIYSEFGLVFIIILTCYDHCHLEHLRLAKNKLILYRLSANFTNTLRQTRSNNFSCYANELFKHAWPFCGIGTYRVKMLRQYWRRFAQRLRLWTSCAETIHWNNIELTELPQLYVNWPHCKNNLGSYLYSGRKLLVPMKPSDNLMTYLSSFD